MSSPIQKWQLLEGGDFTPDIINPVLNVMCDVGEFELWVASCNNTGYMWQIEVYYKQNTDQPIHTFTFECEPHMWVSMELLAKVEQFVKNNCEQVFLRLFTDFKEFKGLLECRP